MGKNKKTNKAFSPASPPPSEGLSSVGKTLAAAGGALVVAGFVALSFADPLGRNWAARLSPFLLIAGYAAIGLGLFLPPEKTIKADDLS
jgi:hypothetical protein